MARRRVLVIGLGRFGRAVAESVVEAGGEVIAVDTKLPLVEAVRDRVTVAAQVETLDVETLRQLGATEVDAAVVAIGEDFAAEVLAVALLKELEIPQIVARTQTDRERRILELVGATRVVSVEVEMGQRVARSLATPDVLDHVTLGPDVSLVYWTADERVVGRSLADSELRSRWHLGLVGVRPGGTDKLDVPPAPDHVFREGDVLLLVGHDARLASFVR